MVISLSSNIWTSCFSSLFGHPVSQFLHWLFVVNKTLIRPFSGSWKKLQIHLAKCNLVQAGCPQLCKKKTISKFNIDKSVYKQRTISTAPIIHLRFLKQQHWNLQHLFYWFSYCGYNQTFKICCEIQILRDMPSIILLKCKNIKSKWN